MIAACPQCQTRFRLAKEKIGPQGARIRCSSCQTIFRVQAPETIADAEMIAEARPTPAIAKPAPPPPAPKPLPPLARALVVEADAELAKGIVDLLASWRIRSDVVHDGGQGLLALFRNPPQLAVFGAGLPSLSAPQMAEIVRRTPELITVKLVRVAVSDEPPAGDHDAEEMLEPGDLPAGLGEILARFALGAKPSAAPLAPKPSVAPAKPMPAAAPPQPKPPAPMASKPPMPTIPKPAMESPRPAPAPAATAASPTAAMPGASSRPVPSSDPEIAAAERLARIAVSDVILYNEAKFAQAAASGNVAKALASELEEARQHFNSRVSPVLRQKRDFLNEELERRAAQRKA